MRQCRSGNERDGPGLTNFHGRCVMFSMCHRVRLRLMLPASSEAITLRMGTRAVALFSICAITGGLLHLPFMAETTQVGCLSIPTALSWASLQNAFFNITRRLVHIQFCVHEDGLARPRSPDVICLHPKSPAGFHAASSVACASNPIGCAGDGEENSCSSISASRPDGLRPSNSPAETDGVRYSMRR